MRNKNLALALGVGVLITIIVVGIASVIFRTSNNLQTESIAVRPVSQQILADGTVTSQNEAVLHFQTGGKLAYLPVKEGDTVSAGQVIGSLDTYMLQQQLRSALNTYQSTRDQFDQAQTNQSNTITQKNQAGQLNFYGAGLPAYGTNSDSTNYLNDVAKRIVDENQANLNNSVINVQIANYAIQLASITSPINGIVTHEDVTIAGVNVSPTTSFVIDDPSSLVFKANVSENDIDFVSVGALVQIDMSGRTLSGTVSKIYPQKLTLANGDNVYQVDIQSDNLLADAQLGQTVTILIQSNANSDVILVPSWVVLNHQYVWVFEDGKAKLKQITVGKEHGVNIEVTSGLLPSDKVITNPQTIANNTYRFL